MHCLGHLICVCIKTTNITNEIKLLFNANKHFAWVLLSCPIKVINCLTYSRLASDLKNYVLMNALRNRVQLIGNLGNRSRSYYLEAAASWAKFAIATNRDLQKCSRRKKVNGYASWHNVVAWGKTR